MSAIELPDSGQRNVFRKEGEYWTLGFEGQTIRLKSARGLDYLSFLLQRPYQEIHALDLGAALNHGSRVPQGPTVNKEQMLDVGLSISTLGDAGEVLDQQATNEYKKAIEEFKEEYDEAERFNDTELAARLSENIQLLEAQLTGAYGLGGRTRKAGDIPERARKAISAALSRSLSKIENAHPSLERHLRNSIKTGTFCSYSPDSPTPWDH